MLNFKTIFNIAVGLTVMALPAMAQQGEPCLKLMEGAEERLAKDISYLASDELAGREPGTDGAQLAARYIEQNFMELELTPLVEEGYLQRFTINSGVTKKQDQNSLTYKNTTYSIPEDYFPLTYSSNGLAEGKTVFVKYGITAPEKEYDDYKKLGSKKLQEKIFVMDISSPDGIHPHSEYKSYHSLSSRVKLAKSKGAKAVIFVNLKGTANDPSPDFRDLKSEGIPVVFIQNKKLAKQIRKGKLLKLETHLKQETIDAFNIVGFLNNDAERTVVIGAHYDHLGMGGSSSLYRDKKPAIHNGADDNASGTAGLLELARNVKSRPDLFRKYNYLFVAFSGEERGLLGSSYFVKNSPVETGLMAYMFNMDMIGRLEDFELAVSGTGTSLVWDKIIGKRGCDELKLKTSGSGVGPSDHTSFYYRDIPVLHFFSGTHNDYHKPTDDFERINIKGEVDILSFILSLMKTMESYPNAEFTPTQNQSMNAPKFSVTLGVLPDYMFSGKGMKIDGVTEGKPAAKAGMRAGDVVVKLGSIPVEDMMSYMQALGAFKAGDKTEVIYMREGKKMKADIQF